MDSLIEETGANGRFQKATLIFLSAIQAIASMTLYVTIFNVAEPTLNCKSIQPDNTYNNNATELLVQPKCTMWNNYSQSKELQQESPFKCEFETIYYKKTIINEWGLLCDKQNLAAITQTIFLIGNIAAFLSGNYLSVKYI